MAESLFLQRLETIARYSVYLSAALLPFTRALTVNIGWPLKIYEVLLTLAIAYYFVIRWRRTRSAFLYPEIIAILSFCAWCILGLAVNYSGGTVPDTSGPPARFGPLLDGLASLAYVIFDVLVLIMVVRQFSGHARTIVQYWLCGTVVAGIYGWVVFLSSYAGLPVWLLPGTDAPQWFRYGGYSALRMGTFLEGNNAGLYFIVSALLAFSFGYRKTGWFALSSVYPTLSTHGVLVALLVLIADLYHRQVMKEDRPRRFWFAVVVTLSIFSMLLLSDPLLRGAILGKAANGIAKWSQVDSFPTTTEPPTDLHPAQPIRSKDDLRTANSLLDRIETAKVALQMWLDSPIFGVGLSQFGGHFFRYTNKNLWPFPEEKRIPNNVYLQLLSETGIVGFCLFFSFLTMVFVKGSSTSPFHRRLGFLVVLAMFVAYPAVTTTYIWVYFAVMASNPRDTSR